MVVGLEIGVVDLKDDHWDIQAVGAMEFDLAADWVEKWVYVMVDLLVGNLANEKVAEKEND
jgi:hypothetical protein